MANEARTVVAKGWTTSQVYVMASICLVIGLALGYLFRGSASRTASTSQAVSMPAPVPASSASAGSASPALVSSGPASPSSGSPGSAQQMPSLDDMKRMADKKAEPLLAKLKTDPNNSQLLNQIGMLYKATHQFKDAAGYFQKAVDADPKNVAARTDLATCLFYQGDADGAIQQLQQSLSYDPKDANSLFNLGMIRLQAKNDPHGAIAAWQQLLKLNPKLADDKKAAVQKLIAQARKPKVSE